MFDPVGPAWRWDIDRIRARSYTENVADLMVEKMKRLSAPAQEAMKQLACLGNVANVATLTLVYEQTEDALHAGLWEAVHAGLVLRQESAYTFLHDRIQQAAYSLIPEERRADTHLRIGRMLLTTMMADQLDEHLFDVASQLNRGAARLIERDEKAEVATIDLRAGRRAKASAAYASACVYFAAGMALLDERDWDSQYDLMFSLRLERAECEFLSGNFGEAEQRIAESLQRGVETRSGGRISPESSHPDREVGERAGCSQCARVPPPVRHRPAGTPDLGTGRGRIRDGLADPQWASDREPDRSADDDRSGNAGLRPNAGGPQPPAYFSDFHAFCLVACRTVKIGMQHGISDASTLGFALLGFISGPVFHRYGEGYQFAKLACDLAEKHVSSPTSRRSTTRQGPYRILLDAAERRRDRFHASDLSRRG